MAQQEHAIRVTRAQLYDLVWQAPMRTLAQRFGISDVGLAKTCRRMRIPLPGRGHWAKKAAGKRVRRPPLPALGRGESEVPREVVLGPPRAVSTQEAALPSAVAEMIAFERRPENRITVPDALRSVHPLVRTTLQALEGSTRPSDHFVGNWRVRHLDVDVSRAALRRALRITDALVKAFEKRGWSVTLGAGDDRKSYVIVFGQRIPFGIREPRRQIPNDPPKPVRLPTGETYTPFHRRYREVPSGHLAMVIRNGWGHAVSKTYCETESRPLEERLNDFVVAVIRAAHEEAENERRRREDEERRRVAEELRIAEERRRRLEAARRQALEDQAQRWRRSRTLKEYLAAVRGRAEAVSGGLVAGSELAAWLEWAEAYAQMLDPLAGPLEELTEVPRDTRAG